MSCIFFFLMIRRPPRSTRTDPLFPDTTLFRSRLQSVPDARDGAAGDRPDRHLPVDRTVRAGDAPGADPGDGVPRDSAMVAGRRVRSEEHTSELQSLMRISYAVFCLKKKKQINKMLQQVTNNPSYIGQFKQ